MSHDTPVKTTSSINMSALQSSGPATPPPPPPCVGFTATESSSLTTEQW